MASSDRDRSRCREMLEGLAMRREDTCSAHLFRHSSTWAIRHYFHIRTHEVVSAWNHGCACSCHLADVTPPQRCLQTPGFSVQAKGQKPIQLVGQVVERDKKHGVTGNFLLLGSISWSCPSDLEGCWLLAILASLDYAMTVKRELASARSNRRILCM